MCLQDSVVQGLRLREGPEVAYLLEPWGFKAVLSEVRLQTLVCCLQAHVSWFLTIRPQGDGGSK